MSISSPSLLLLLLVLLPVAAFIGWPRTRFRRLRDGLSLFLRSVILTLLVLALAGVQVVQSADRLAVVFLVDRSDSMTDVPEAAITQYIEDAFDAMRQDDEAAVVVFGADAQVARAMSRSRELSDLNAVPVNRGGTDLAEAVKLALFLFPDAAARRIVVMSDGQPTTGDWQEAAQLAAANNVAVSYVAFERPTDPEVQVKAVTAPPRLDEDQAFTLGITLVSESDTRGDIIVLSGGQPVQTLEDVAIFAGENTYPVRLRSGASGFRSYEVRVDVPQQDDNFGQNNRLSAYSRVEGVPRVLLVDGSGTSDFGAAVDEVSNLAQALRDSGLEVALTVPRSLPQGVRSLADYDSVVLVNVPATALSIQQMETMQTYVRDLGGGLVVVGGPNSYAPGLYFETPLEEALPVTMEIVDQQRLPELTLVYVIDRSGSMGSTSPTGVPHIDLAKEAIIRSIDFLQPTDRAGVVSFDDVAYWVADMQDVRDRSELQRRVATLRASGGTNINNGYAFAAEAMREEPAEIKHIILLTDGGASEGELVETSEELNTVYGVTTSVISLGGFQAAFLQEMADAGQGNYHNVVDADAIPNIFTVEAVLATRTYIQENAFTPEQTAIHPIMQGISATPQLYGYVAATPRDAAQIILRGPAPYSDPLLAAWQYGLGRSVAFTSDATARWARDWVGWEGYADFWSQAVRWTITEGAASNLETRVVMGDDSARLIVEARDNDSGFLNGLELTASIVYTPDPDQSGTVTLRQVAPGRYEASFVPQGEGAYLIRVADESTQEADPTLELTQTAGWVMSYSPEYDIRPVEADALPAMADLTGGEAVAGDPAAAVAPMAARNKADQPIWPWLLLAAMVLLPVDIALRRLLITRSDLRRLRRWAAAQVRPAREADEATVERMSTLKEARDRARDSAGRATDDADTLPKPPSAVPPRAQPPAQPRVDLRERPAVPRPPAPPRPQPPPDDDNIGARLLKKRRRDDD